MSEKTGAGLPREGARVDAGHSGMTKAELIAALQPLPDDARILIESNPDEDTLVNIRFVEMNADEGTGSYATLVGPCPDDRQ